MTGSWAGAMGQPQFIPSTFVNFAVDYDGDGHRDIWHNLPDVFASAANYLSQEGWRGDRTWGRQVELPSGFDYSLASLAVKKPLGEWAAIGRASCRERVCQSVWISVGGVILKKKKEK